jgi:hypothetical protein
MRTILATAVLVAVPALTLAAPSASASCDPKYRPLCVNDCQRQLPDPKDPLGTLVRVCPD